MSTVLAYLDPGSGSMILQIIAGGLAAVAVTAKLYWNRILRFLRIRKDEPETVAGGRAARRPTPPETRTSAPARPSALHYCAARSNDHRHALNLPGLARARLLSRSRKPRVLRRGRGLPGAFGRWPERLRGAAGDRAARRRARGAHRDRRGHRRAARPAGPRAGRGAAPRAHSVRLLPLRVDVLDAQGRRAAAARPAAQLARARPGAQGRHALQRAVQGRAAGVRRRRLVRAHAARASPGSATASSACSTSTRCCSSRSRTCPSTPGCGARSTASRPTQMRSLMSFRDRFRKGVFTNVFLHAKLEARYADRPDQVKREVKRRASRRSSSWPTCARCASWSSGSSGIRPRACGPPTASATPTPTTTPRRKDEFVREVATEPRLEARVGHRREQRPLLAHRRRGREDGGRGRRRPGPGRAALPRPAQGGATSRSSR